MIPTKELRHNLSMSFKTREESSHDSLLKSLAESQIQNDIIGLIWIFRPENPNELLSLMSNEMDEVGLQPTSL